MGTSKVFLSGDTSANVLRGVYEAGSRGDLSAWASEAGLFVSDRAGLMSSTYSEPTLAMASGSASTIRQILGRCPIPNELLGEMPELLFASSGGKPRQNGLTARLWTTAVPNGAFLAIGHEVQVSSPAFTLVLRAKGLGLFGTMSYGNELCGSFSCDESSRGINDHVPFVTTSQLKAFLDGCARSKGLKNARVAAKWLRDGFRSPRESDLYLLLELSRDYGGYGFLHVPAVNARVIVAPKLRYLAGVESYEVDLLWREAKVIVEYDGEPHDDPEQKVRDDIKTQVLQEMGYKVFRITWDIMSDVREFDLRARMLGARLGEPVPYTTKEFAAKRTRLREALFYGPR